MASSNFKVFAESVAALNVVSDAEYATDTQRINGVVPGLAPAALHNKLYKQATIMAAALAQVIVEQGQDALDSDYEKLVASIKNSFVLSLNGERPDAAGNIQKNFVYSVEGKTPDSAGNVSLNIDYLNAMSFVGSVIITKDNINPGSKIGGTWQLLEAGRYIRAAGAGYPGGSTGGSDGFTLNANNLPAHTHSATVYSADLRGTFIAANQVGLDGGKTTGVFSRTGTWAGTCANKGDPREMVSFNGNHTHQITIGSAGNGEKITFEPSYLLLYFWVRTA